MMCSHLWPIHEVILFLGELINSYMIGPEEVPAQRVTHPPPLNSGMTLILGLRSFHLPFWRNLSASLLQSDFWPSRSYSFHVIFKEPFGPCGCCLFGFPNHEKHKSQTIHQRFPIILSLILVCFHQLVRLFFIPSVLMLPKANTSRTSSAYFHWWQRSFQSKLQEVEGPLWIFTCQRVVTLITSGWLFKLVLSKRNIRCSYSIENITRGEQTG